MSKMDAVVKLVLFFFVTLLSFSVGTYVGKQVSDAEHRKANLESDGNERTPASVEEHTTENHAAAKPAHGEEQAATEKTEKKEAHAEEQQGEALTQKELDQLAEEFSNQAEPQREVASEKPAAPHAEPKSEKKDSHGYKSFERGGKAPASAPAHTKEAAPAPVKEKEAAAPAPASEEATTRKPSSLPSVAENSAGKFTLQVGSFTTEKDAQDKAKELKAKGWNAFYIPADVKGQRRYRLNVGLFTSLKSAQEFKKEFSKESKNNDVLIQKIVQ